MRQDIQDFVNRTSGFFSKTAVDQLLDLAWFLHARQNKTNFNGELLRQCFRDAGVEPPNTSVYLARLAAKKPAQIVREKGGFRLAGASRRMLDSKHGGDPVTAAVAKALSDLPAKLPNLAEREFLSEALNCYRVKAFRASITMVWNLAYDHLVRWMLEDSGRLSALNAAIATKYPKKSLILSRMEDLEEIKEFELIEAARVAKLLDKNTTQILKEKLGRRNMAAHPSQVAITQHQADDMITDLVANVILKLA